MYSDAQKKQLLGIARSSIRHGLDNGRALNILPGDYDQELQQQRACFVTLQINHQLRGCIGSLEAHRPLVEDVAENAYAAAFRDPRFSPVTEREYDQLHYHISVLTKPEAMSFNSQQDLLDQIRPGIDGLVLSDKGYRGTFLPSVWEQLPTREEFLSHLKMKAGLPSSYWSDTLKVERYTAEDIE